MSRLMVFMIALMVPSVAIATSAAMPDMSFLNKSYATMKAAAKTEKPIWLKTTAPEKDKESAAAFLRQAQADLHRSVGQHPNRQAEHMDLNKGVHLVIYATMAPSFDFGTALKFLSSYKNDKRISISLAGLPKGCKTFNCAATKVMDFGRKEGLSPGDYPPVNLDPLGFRKNKIKVAPTMIYFKDGKAISRVEGLINPKWLLDRVGQKKDFGIEGSVVAITEVNLMDEIKRRLSHMDIRKMKRDALADYWKDKKFELLPQAKEATVRRFTPIVRAMEAIKDSKGNVIVPKGTTINPLTKMTFTRALIIYDPTRKGERKEAMKLYKEAYSKRLIPILLITQPKERSLNGVFAEEKAVGVRVFILNKQIVSRFEVKHTPAMVTADNTRKEFVIHEYPVQ